ncbi:conserved membrane hypothetical protein [Brevundimonas sp. G8]|nr:conserved membrane hypothetical protein [Brevundimonas sp. G8]
MGLRDPHGRHGPGDGEVPLMTKWALAILLVLSAPIAFYVGRTALDLPHYVSEQLLQGNLLSSGGLWNLFLRLVPALWLLCGAWVVVVWRQTPPTSHRQRVLNILVGGLLLTLTAVTAFFVYVFWAWSQM